MFEPLSDVIRLRRLQRNLTQERLAKMAGVSRRQLSLLEDGRNVSLLFLVKIATALELTQLPLGELRLRASQPELTTIVRATGILVRMKQAVPEWDVLTGKILEGIAGLEELLDKSLASGASAATIMDAADDLAGLPAGERDAAGETLRSLAGSEPAARPARPRPAAAAKARRSGR